MPEQFIPTNQRRMDPEPTEALAELDDYNVETAVMLRVSGERFRRMVEFPVLVENWDKRKSGRGRRAWMREFTETERRKIARYYGRFYRWYLVTGTPRQVVLRIPTLQLLKRACHFFAVTIHERI